jgi:hypothetical protein
MHPTLRPIALPSLEYCGTIDADNPSSPRLTLRRRSPVNGSHFSSRTTWGTRSTRTDLESDSILIFLIYECRMTATTVEPNEEFDECASVEPKEVLTYDLNEATRDTPVRSYPQGALLHTISARE